VDSGLSRAVVIDGPYVEFDGWYRLAHPRLVASLLLISGSTEDALEATDEAFLRAWVHWKRVGAMAAREGWVYTVGVNDLRRRARRRAIEARLLGRMVQDGTVPAPGGEAWDAVRHLPRRRREAVVLRYVADLTEADIAAVMGIRRGTVSAALGASRRSLAIMLSDSTTPSAETP